jgi:hypothetical protein
VRKGDCVLLYPHDVTTEEAKQWALTSCSKRHKKTMFTCLSDSSHITPATTAWNTMTISKMGPTIVVGLPKLTVPRPNPPVGSVPPKANRVRDKAKQRMASS